MTNDPIVAEVRAIRSQIAAECNFDIRRIVEEARKRQQESGRDVIPVRTTRGVGTQHAVAVTNGAEPSEAGH